MAPRPALRDVPYERGGRISWRAMPDVMNSVHEDTGKSAEPPP
ncbi:hypothetical protein ACFC0M_10700 [Streptomyces sp. NPDC056149]|nr:hypothetical protein [Streptomyces sp. WZ-12]